MKKLFFLLIFGLCACLSQAQTVENKLINAGAWFLFSNRLEQQDGENVLTQVEFFKKNDMSSLLFDKNNRLYSVFGDDGSEMNEDLWKMLDNNSFVITDMTGTATQIMEIIELSNKKLVLRYCDDSIPESVKCVISTYFPTKGGWLSDQQIDELNSAGVIEMAETP